MQHTSKFLIRTFVGLEIAAAGSLGKVRLRCSAWHTIQRTQPIIIALEPPALSWVSALEDRRYGSSHDARVTSSHL